MSPRSRASRITPRASSRSARQRLVHDHRHARASASSATARGSGWGRRRRRGRTAPTARRRRPRPRPRNGRAPRPARSRIARHHGRQRQPGGRLRSAGRGRTAPARHSRPARRGCQSSPQAKPIRRHARRGTARTGRRARRRWASASSRPSGSPASAPAANASYCCSSPVIAVDSSAEAWICSSISDVVARPPPAGSSIGNTRPVLAGDRLQRGRPPPRVFGLREIVRYVHRVAHDVVPLGAEPELQQRGHAARHLDPAEGAGLAG